MISNKFLFHVETTKAINEATCKIIQLLRDALRQKLQSPNAEHEVKSFYRFWICIFYQTSHVLREHSKKY